MSVSASNRSHHPVLLGADGVCAGAVACADPELFTGSAAVLGSDGNCV